jgi:hypothetical protein
MESWTHLSIAAGLVALLGCSSSSAPSSSVQDETSGKDASDSNCRIVLRYAGLSELNGGEVFTDAKTHKSWARYRAVADVDSSLLDAGAVVSLRYRAVFTGDAVGGTFPGPFVDVKAINATDDPGDLALGHPGVGLSGGKDVPKGFTRVSFATTTDTMEAGDDVAPTLQMIPFVHLPNGKNVFDHNRNADPEGMYNLDRGTHFVVTDDFNVCPSPPP